ncbi:MAG TPA: hypothetical protein VFL71_01220 [Actinomycetes bacterium]|nr:hypothetical protein [Actinomycetes bacterium]
METEDRPAPPPPTPGGTSRRAAVAAIAAALLLVVAVVAVFATRGDGDAAGSTAPEPPPSQTTAAATTTTIDTETEVVARLREILRVREEALAARDPNLLDQVYASDCPCLKAGRDAIAALRNEHVVWKGRSISLQVQSTQPVNVRLWEVVALFTSGRFRIETEEGGLIREAPAERIRYRFLLVRLAEGEPWLLGSVSVLKGA